MAIVTREQVKTFLQISGVDKDDLIDALIPQVEADYERIRNIPFDKVDGDVEYPSGSALTAALMVGYLLNAPRVAGGLDSESLGDYSYSRSDVGRDGYPPQVISSIRRYVRFG